MGATSGIGLEVALLLANKGWLVGIAGRRQELLEQIQKAVITPCNSMPLKWLAR